MLAPDYGMMLVRAGLGDVIQFFYDLPITHLARSSPQLYTFLINLERDGVEYAVSFDFGPDQVEALLQSAMTEPRRSSLGRTLREMRPGTRCDLEPALVAPVVETRVGEIQRWEKEEFRPLVVVRVG